MASNPLIGRTPKEDADSVTIGVILRPHGIRGEVVVEPLTDNETRFATLEAVRVVTPSGRDLRLKVESMFPHKGKLVIGFEGRATRDEAEELRGGELRIPVASLPPLPEGSYYHHELAGLAVRNESGEPIGRVESLWETGATPVLIIKDADGRETLLPLVHQFLVEVNVRGGYLVAKAAGLVRS